MKSTAQVSAEFLIVLVLLFSLLLFSLFVFGERQEGFILSKELAEAEFIAGKIARTINFAWLSGNGASAEILLEKNLDYSVSFFENSVMVNWRDNFSSAALLTEKISTGTITAGNFVKVQNNNGEIRIENA
ncbi:MAG: hypothetical protein HYW50_04710 [Candidatus Diapherotrites archaeon]|nr:hypothetical protein [Candidatus Diapherotrites archaeon]